MNPIIALFWDSEQGRLRALWRLLGQAALFFVVTMVLVAVASFIGFGLLISQGNITPSQLSNTQDIQQLLNNAPGLAIMTSISIFLAMLLSVWIAGRGLDHRPLADFGLHFSRDWWVDFGFGLFLGAALMAVIFLVELAASWVTVTGTFVTVGPIKPFFPAILIPLVLFLSVGIYEEMFSRGYQLVNLAEGLNFIGPRGAALLAALLSSVVFGWLHITNPNANNFSSVNIFVGGAVLFSLGVLLTGELAIPIGIHIAWNFFQGNVFGFPVSGTGIRAATFIRTQQSGPDLWTGGAFGPEGGLIGLGAMLLGGILILVWVKSRHGSLEIQQGLAAAPEHKDKERNLELEEEI